MPPKATEQQRRDKSPDNRGKIGEKKDQHGRKKSDDEGAMDKLKDKMGGLLHSDKKDYEKDSKKDDKKDGKSRSRSRSRERQQGKNKSPERKGPSGVGQGNRSRSRERQQGKNQSPDRKGTGAGAGGLQKGRQESRSRSRERQQGKNQSPGRQGPGTNKDNHQQPMKMAGAGAAGAGVGAGAGAAATRQGQGHGPDAQKQHTGPGAAGAQGGQANQRARTKRGLCWPRENKNEDPERFTRPGSKVSWYYNWSPHATKGADGLQFVPMQWNGGGIRELSDNVKRTDAKAVMTFNEPELKDQASMSVDDAVEQWMKYIEPLRKQGIRCGSPGISNAGHAVQWMQDFWQKIKRHGSDVDFWCFHWYGPDLGPFYDYVWSTHNQLDPKKKAWITEFACTNWDQANPMPKEHVENFARESFKYLDTLDWVERYCWFAPTKSIGNVGKHAAMYNEQGNLTEVGKMFRGD